MGSRSGTRRTTDLSGSTSERRSWQPPSAKADVTMQWHYPRGRDRNKSAQTRRSESMRKSPYLGDKAFVIAGLAGVVACAWAYLIPASLDMYGRMDGAAAWMMEATWDTDYLLLICSMWAAMMVAMMLPSALPTILIFHKAVRNDPAVPSPSQIGRASCRERV